MTEDGKFVDTRNGAALPSIIGLVNSSFAPGQLAFVKLCQDLHLAIMFMIVF